MVENTLFCESLPSNYYIGGSTESPPSNYYIGDSTCIMTSMYKVDASYYGVACDCSKMLLTNIWPMSSPTFY